MNGRFEYGNARVRARRSDLLGRADYEALVALDIAGLLATLSDTPYQPDLVEATPRYRGVRLFEEAVRTNLARNLQDLVSWYEGRAARQVQLLVVRWDFRNIRTILRGQYAGAPDEIRAALVPAGHLGDDVLGELAGQAGLRPTVALMVAWGVPTAPSARAVAAGLEEFESSADFQVLERAIDRATAADLADALANAEPEIAQILNAETDQANLLTVLRVHQSTPERQGWDDEDLQHRLLPGGTLSTEMLGRAGQAADRAAATAIVAEAPLTASWRPALERWTETGNLVELSDDLDELLTRRAVGMFATADPLGPGVPAAFVWAKENEVANLRAIGANVAAGMPPEQIEEKLVILS